MNERDALYHLKQRQIDVQRAAEEIRLARQFARRRDPGLKRLAGQIMTSFKRFVRVGAPKPVAVKPPINVTRSERSTV